MHATDCTCVNDYTMWRQGWDPTETNTPVYSVVGGLADWASGANSSALGVMNTAGAYGAQAIGYKNFVYGQTSTGVGINNKVYGKESVVLGFANVIGEYSDATGAAVADKGKNTFVFGSYVKTSANNAIVLGSNIETVADNSVVIGNGSTSEAANTVSVGSATVKRKIVHVADGEANTDAATFGQVVKNDTYAASHGKVEIKTNGGETAFTITGLETSGTDLGDTQKLVDAGLGDTVTDSILSVNDKVGSLSNDINKVGAGAAALAALHPEGFDPADKWSFAVGYGHYKNANAGALGAFYKPNFDTTVSIGGTIGNGDPMLNAGVSFKLGRRSERAVGLSAENAQLRSEVQELKAQMQILQQQMAQMAQQLQR